MAERSKVPDSRLITFPAHSGSGRGLNPTLDSMLFFLLSDYLPFIT